MTELEIRQKVLAKTLLAVGKAFRTATNPEITPDSIRFDYRGNRYRVSVNARGFVERIEGNFLVNDEYAADVEEVLNKCL